MLYCQSLCCSFDLVSWPYWFQTVGFCKWKFTCIEKANCVPQKSLDPVIPLHGQENSQIVLWITLWFFRTVDIPHHCVNITSQWKRALFWQMWWTIFHDAMIFFCWTPCETFQSHTWLMTDFIFLCWVQVLYTKYKLSWIAHNQLFLWGLYMVCPSASCSADAPWKTEQA